MSADLLNMKKSQIKMMETTGVLMVFFIILVIGLVFYANLRMGGVKEQIGEYREQRLIENMQKLLFLPELQCSRQGVEVYTCVDLLKIKALSKVMNVSSNKIYYSDELGNSLVTVQEIYPGNNTYILYDRLGNGSLSSSFIPISLWDPLTDSFHMGLLTVKTG
jgi:hypothetical protein